MRNISEYLTFELIKREAIECQTNDNDYKIEWLYYIFAGNERQVERIKQFWQTKYPKSYEAFRMKVDTENKPYLYWIEAKWMLQFIYNTYGEGIYYRVEKLLEDESGISIYDLIKTFHYDCKMPIFIKPYVTKKED